MRTLILSLLISFLIGTYAIAQETTVHSNGLTVNGTIESTSGGFKYPDGSMQSTAYTNIGDYCWNLSIAGNVEGFIKLAMIKININNYISSGYSTNTSTSATGAINGNAILSNNQMLMTLTESHIDQYATSISTFSLVLDDTTWDGTFAVIAQDYNYSQGAFEALSHVSGTASNVTCP
jgi:hypothetical protein